MKPIFNQRCGESIHRSRPLPIGESYFSKDSKEKLGRLVSISNCGESMTFTLASDEIALLEWAFSENCWFSTWLEDRSKTPIDTWFSCIDVLSDIKSLPIKGIQKKFAEIGHPNKLLPIFSELKAAKILATRNFEVELLSDNDRRFRQRGRSMQSPDLLVKRKEFQLLVEVQRKLSDYDIEYELHQELHPLLKERDFNLSISYSKDLSKLSVDSNTRGEKEEAFSDFAETLRQCLEPLDQDKLPCDFELNGSKISVKAAEPGRGRISSCVTAVTKVPEEEYIDQIKIAVKKKACKRNSWKEDYLALPYLIFLDLETAELSEAVFSALYGSRTWIERLEPDKVGRQRVDYPQFVVDKFQGNQRELLFKLGFDSRRCSYINEPGSFVTEESVKRNISSVVTMLNREVECFPNPFCDPAIYLSNLPEFLSIPLTSFAVGGSGLSTTV